MNWGFGRNAASQIDTVTRSNDFYAWTGHYAVARAYAADGLNRYSNAGGASFSYDNNGNLTGDGSRTYGYDIENRLISASGGLTLSYDPLGRLFQTSGGASGTTRFLYDGDALVAEYNDSGTLLRRYVHGGGVDEPLLWYEGAGISSANRRAFYPDAQGSIVGVADAAGNALFLNRYDEYGIPAATNQGRFQYTGQIWLPDLGMYHYKARIYSPTLGRFLQTDPVGYQDQYNLYAYVRNDPINGSDPTGRRVVWEYTNGGTQQQRDAGLIRLKRSETWTTRFRKLEADPRPMTIEVNPTGLNHAQSNNRIVWNPTLGVETRKHEFQSEVVSLAHEVDHGYRQLTDPNFSVDLVTPTPLVPNPPSGWTVNEDKATDFSNQVASELGEPTQRNYGDALREVPVPKPHHLQDPK